MGAGIRRCVFGGRPRLHDRALDRIESRARFDYVRYANVWEDADVLCQALQPAPGKRMLSIASGGDNSFALAADGADVVAVDLSPAQLSLVELKRAAIRVLEHEELLGFLGVHDSDRRLETYRRIATGLPGDARAFWDGRTDQVRAQSESAVPAPIRSHRRTRPIER